MSALRAAPRQQDGPAVARCRSAARIAIVIFYFAAGVLHLAAPGPFLWITPDFVPWPRLVIAATGACEIAGAIGLLVPRLRGLAGVMLALYAVCVFPANVKQAFEHIVIAGYPSNWAFQAFRLTLQPAIVWWALFAGGVVSWPFAGRRSGLLTPPTACARD